MPDPIQFNPNDKEAYTFDKLIDDAPSLSKKIIKQGTTRNSLVANLLLVIFSLIFFGLAAFIAWKYIFGVV